jgi:mannose-6-phosphate isomerase-like protein (cupin superfamily)
LCSALSFTLALALGCQGAPGGRTLLPEPPKENVAFSPYEPASPYAQLAPGLLARKVFDAASATGYNVEVLDLLVAPGQRATDVSLAGAAVFEVRAGNGALSRGGTTEEVKTGSTFALSQGTSFSLENRGELPITVRVFVITAN